MICIYYIYRYRCFSSAVCISVSIIIHQPEIWHRGEVVFPPAQPTNFGIAPTSATFVDSLRIAKHLKPTPTPKAAPSKYDC